MLGSLLLVVVVAGCKSKASRFGSGDMSAGGESGGSGEASVGSPSSGGTGSC